MNKSQKKKVRQITNGKLTSEEVQHLRRCGFTITKSPSKRPIRRFAAWGETTPVEKSLEDIVFLLKNAALLNIINLVAGITIIICLITWWTGKTERWEDEIFSTWQVVNDASEDKSGVTKLALQRLLRNGFSLSGLNLKKTNLYRANLQEAVLHRANLQEANLEGANLQGANLEGANLPEANLETANLQEANLEGANLQGAVLHRANLPEANLAGANLAEISLAGANLAEISLSFANLEEAVLIETKNLTPKQIKSACFWEEAFYKGEWDEEKKTWETIEPDNTNHIKQLKDDKASDPEEAVDCSGWEK